MRFSTTAKLAVEPHQQLRTAHYDYSDQAKAGAAGQAIELPAVRPDLRRLRGNAIKTMGESCPIH